MSPPPEARVVCEEEDAERERRFVRAHLVALTLGALVLTSVGVVRGVYATLVMLPVCAWAWVRTRSMTRVLTTRMHATGLWILHGSAWELIPWPTISEVKLAGPGSHAESTPSSWGRSILKPVALDAEDASRFVIVFLREGRRGIGSAWAIACHDTGAARSLGKEISAATTASTPYRDAPVRIST